MSLHVRAIQAFDEALERAGSHPELERLQVALVQAREHLDEPMRVAIVGHIKAGKSTMLNALLGEELAPTGNEELTFNVNLLCHGRDPSLTVHFKDGREPEERTMDELTRLTARDEQHLELLRSIDYLEVRRPIELLRRFDLVDTPGLRSVHLEDSLNTLRKLRLGRDDLDETTKRESGMADAILCMFSRSLAVAEQSIVDEFQGELLGEAAPINAFGVLSKSDAYWDPYDDPQADPLEAGRRVADLIEQEPDADRVFYTVLPVCGLLGCGAQTASDADLDAVEALSALAEDDLTDFLGDAESFAEVEDDALPVPPAMRAALVLKLGVYGIWLAARLMREGLTDRAALRQELLDRSGVGALRDLLISHFGRRALLIKVQSGVRKGRAEILPLRQRVSDSGEAARAAGGVLEALESSEPAFEEFALLRSYYQDGDTLGLRNGEAEELLRVTGEFGTSLGPRLGLDERSLPGEMIPVAERRLVHWRKRGGRFGVDPRTESTARIMAGAYERMLIHAREAHRHLELDQ